MKKFKKFLKISLIISVISLALLSCGGIIFYHAITSGIDLNHEALNQTKAESSISIFDKNGNAITKPKQSFIKLSKLASHTKDAFISAEDKRFFSHTGIDLMRIGKAAISNIKSGNFSQGASTISQQLIKNTQLTNEKTLKRKIKEIKLTRQLENTYSKNEILEMYLNNIYFGNGCYGIESASWHYFSKSASELTISESALLAATINAPSIFNPEDNPENAKERRNLILNLMQNNNKISEIQCKSSQNEPILLKLQNLSNNNILYNKVLDEACEILNITPVKLLNNNYKIYTNINIELSNNINSAIKNNYSNLPNNLEIATIVIDNYSNKIISLTGNKSSFASKKQPGSAIKPILVFAPAIEKGLISPATKILDEPINISGYSPSNSNGQFHGFVSVREALKNSYNIPAVKILNELGIIEAQNFAKKLGIEFDENDKNLAIALGGFTNGITLKSLADSYCALANYGKYQSSNFITKITKNNLNIYESKNNKLSVMKNSTAFLITDMLIDTSKSGTAKRLKDFNFEVASKTGTVGMPNSTLNKESFNVAYTTKHTILTYLGGDNMPQNINGSTYPTMITKDILNLLYTNSKPKNFNKPNSIESINLKEEDYNKHIITPEQNGQLIEYFEKNNSPKQNLINSFKIIVINNYNSKPLIKFKSLNNYSYEIIRKQKNEEEIISSSFDNTFNDIKFLDNTAQNNQIYEYFVRFSNKENTAESNHVIIKTY